MVCYGMMEQTNVLRGAGMESNLIVRKNEKMSVMEKLGILSDAAKYDVSCSSSGVGRRGTEPGLGIRWRRESATVSAQMEGVFPFLRSCLPMNVFMTASIVSTAGPTMCRELPSRRTKSAN